MNKDRLTYKKKYQLVLVGAVLVLVAIYQLGIKKTCIYAQQYFDDKQVESSPVVTAFEWDVLEQKEKLLNKIAKAHFTTIVLPDKEILSAVSGLVTQYGVTLDEFPSGVLTKGIEQVYTNKIILEGSFAGLVEMVNKIEESAQLGKVTSADFKTYLDYRTGVNKLVCIIYIQNLLREN